MKRLLVATMLTASSLVPQSGQCQGMFEGLGVRGSAAGMGAGMAASSNHGQLLTRTYESALEAQQRVVAETKVIQQYVQLGCLYEAKKQWNNAEKSFTYALQGIARRDGVGSEKSVPVLKHLVAVTAATHDFTQAISYQKTVVLFAQSQAAKIPNPAAVISEQMTLANLYAQKQDYASAEPILKASLATANNSEVVSQSKRTMVKTTYAQLLRKLHKDAEADALEAEQPSAGDATTNEQAAHGNQVVSQSPAVTTPPAVELPTSTPDAGANPRTADSGTKAAQDQAPKSVSERQVSPSP